MNLQSFLNDLHFDTDQAKPLDWEVDWQDAPLAYKLYRHLPAVPLSPEVPLSLEGREVNGTPTLRDIGDLLWYVFGLTQFRQSVPDLAQAGLQEGSIQSFRRFVPSGGALYPSEMYVYLKMEDTACGVYHYDVAHHRLVLVREGDFDSYLARALGYRCDVSASFCTVFVSTMFWKNFFKYHNFSYRLQGLDAGVLLGQLLEVAKRFGFETGVYFQFLDRAVNHLLGLVEEEESVYAVIPLSMEPAMDWFHHMNDGEKDISSGELCRELPSVRHDHYVRSRNIREYPMLIKMNEASLLDSSRSFRQIGEEISNACAGQAMPLPDVKQIAYDFSTACRSRYSPDMDFILKKVSQTQLAVLLQEVAASFPYRNDLDGERERHQPRVALYGCFYDVEHIPNGAYCYDSAAHALCQIHPGDHRCWLQQGMSMHNVNLFQVPFCFHVVGDKGHLQTELGYRGYRIQQMECGMLVQRLLLTATALGMGGHPLLDYDANLCDELYQLAPHGKTSLIQIPVGHHRPRSKLEGGLHA
jgi:SagB-type dehydrogenase family enzyme